MSEDDHSSPFHRGEREIQERLGVRGRLEDMGRRVIRDHLPDQHREFYAQLPLLMVGSVDEAGRPWASVLFGRPGFVTSPDPKSLSIAAHPVSGDPLNANLSPGTDLGILGLEFHTRRRNRVSGQIARIADGAIEVRVHQAFGNCPQYIQAREFELLPEIDGVGLENPVQRLDWFEYDEAELISRADCCFIATHFSEGGSSPSHGADVSHRGGKPGFVQVDDERTLTFPDFLGNFHFNTLGNILLNPRTGLLFIDFDNRDLLYLTGSAEIRWDSEEGRAFTGAERLVRFKLDEGTLVRRAVPIVWEFRDYSPSLAQSGSWEEVETTLAARREGNRYRDYRITQIEPESAPVTSFYLEPDDGGAVPCHRAGQFLPLELDLPGVGEPVRRTYTISNAPNGEYLRLSIKREGPAAPGLPPGLASNAFHDQVRVGAILRALAPRGKFVLDECSVRPVVLLSAGVGITPMISMLEQLVANSGKCGSERSVWFIHGARNGTEQAFAAHVRDLAAQCQSVRVHFRYSRPAAGEEQGRDFDSLGHVDVELLRSLLPFDDYDFYLCGPTPFMQSIHAGLESMHVPDARIHYEFFGEGASLHRDSPRGFDAQLAEPLDAVPVAVRFARSGVERIWEPSDGTLLDLAESAGLAPPYSCRSGICQTCSTKIVSGDVSYTEPPMAPPVPGEALICSAYPSRTAAEEEEEIVALEL